MRSNLILSLSIRLNLNQLTGFYPNVWNPRGKTEAGKGEAARGPVLALGFGCIIRAIINHPGQLSVRIDRPFN